MIKQTLLTIFSILTSITIFAQKIELKWSPTFDLEKKIRIGDIIKADSSGIVYTLITLNKGYFKSRTTFESVEKVDLNFKPIFSKEIKVSDNDNINVLDLKPLKNINLMLLSEYDKKNKITEYSTQKFDMNYNLDGGIQVLQTLDEDFSKYIISWGTNSDDKSKLVRIYEKSITKKNKDTNKKIYVNLLNGSGSVLYKKSFTLTNRVESMINTEQVRISNDGTIYILTKDYLTENRKEKIKDEKTGKKVPGFQYTIWRIDAKGESLKEFSVNLGEKYINSMEININKNTNNLVATGFYNDDENKSLQGMFNFEIEKDNVIKKNFKDFPDEFVEEFKKHKLDKKNDNDEGLSTSFKVNEVYPKSDGGAVVLAESYRTITVTRTSSNGKTTTTVYYYHEDIIVVNINNDGTIGSFDRIPKRQVEANRIKYSSYISTLYNDKVYVIFNETPKNEELEENKASKKTFNFNSSVCMMYVIDENHNITKSELFKNQDIDKILQPLGSKVIEDNLLLLYAGKKKEDEPQLGILTITDK